MGVSAFLVPGAAPSRDVHLFYNTTKGNVGVEIMSSKSSKDDPDTNYAAAKTARDGIIVPTSHLDSTIVDSMRVVLGITYPTLCEGETIEDVKNFDISIVSPFYQQVTTLPRGINSVAVASDGTAAWVFSLKAGGDDKGSRLQYTTLEELTSTTIQDNTPLAARKTCLSAYYNPVKETAYCYYQTIGKKNFFQQYNVSEDEVSAIQQADNLPDGATIFTVAWAEDINKVYLYYVDKYEDLQRLSLLVDNKDTDNTWSNPKKVGIAKIPADAQLSVVPSAANKLNNIFFRNSKGSFSHEVDKW
jgi:hypothetical protein